MGIRCSCPLARAPRRSPSPRRPPPPRRGSARRQCPPKPRPGVLGRLRPRPRRCRPRRRGGSIRPVAAVRLRQSPVARTSDHWMSTALSRGSPQPRHRRGCGSPRAGRAWRPTRPRRAPPCGSRRERSRVVPHQCITSRCRGRRRRQRCVQPGLGFVAVDPTAGPGRSWSGRRPGSTRGRERGVVGDACRVATGWCRVRSSLEPAVLDHGEHEAGRAELEQVGDVEVVGVADDDVQPAVEVGCRVRLVPGVDDRPLQRGLQADLVSKKSERCASWKPLRRLSTPMPTRPAPHMICRTTKNGVRCLTMSRNGVRPRHQVVLVRAVGRPLPSVLFL
jgi:hypothetical protein